METHAAYPPNHILGLTIRSRTRIYVSYLLPPALELFVYISQIVADCAVSYEHFHSHQPDFGWATLCLILVPPVLTFVFVLSSKEQRENPEHASRWHFVGHHLLQMLLFPCFAVYRFAKRIFWSMEALFHDDDDKERMSCLEKAEECSTCELYHLIQAYGQSAPQIILQLYHMLSQDLFRNYQTTNVQAISLVFSAIDLAAITTTYQRFESQRQVGRHYPWSAPKQLETQRKVLEKDACLRKECEKKRRESERAITTFPESENIMTNFKLQYKAADHERPTSCEPKTHTVLVHASDEVDNDSPVSTNETTVLIHSEELPAHNATDDDKIRVSPKQSIRPAMHTIMCHVDDIDRVPDSPPPLPPTLASLPKIRTSDTPRTANAATQTWRTSGTLSQLEIFKDMLIVNAQLFIKQNVPRPPKVLTKRVQEQQQDSLMTTTTATPPGSPLSPDDVVDFFMPRPTKIVNGIQQDDFAGKSIAFFGWISFIIMRMLSLSTFCVFFPKAFLILLAVHYSVMLLTLYLESWFKGKLNRTLFYMLLAYVYLFVLLEFRIKFKRVRLWLIGYFVITMTENITMTMLWYANEEFESWWFGFIFEGIIYSGILFVATLLVYYYILKPKDVMLIVEDDVNPDSS